jgi:hypothetical protein
MMTTAFILLFLEIVTCKIALQDFNNFAKKKKIFGYPSIESGKKWCLVFTLDQESRLSVITNIICVSPIIGYIVLIIKENRML